MDNDTRTLATERSENWFAGSSQSEFVELVSAECRASAHEQTTAVPWAGQTLEAKLRYSTD